MPKYIVKLERDGEARYMEWSTVVDAPVSDLMTRDAFCRYYVAAHSWGHRSNEEVETELQERLARVDLNGCSVIGIDMTGEECVRWNRAGENEECLTADQIWDKYTESEASDD